MRYPSLLGSISTLTIIIINSISSSTSLPFVLLHGIGQSCNDKKITYMINQLANWSATEGYCVESCSGIINSWFNPLEHQAAIVCDKVKNMEELKQGYHIIGLSQGGLIGRGVIEFCDGAPQVKNLITLAGPHAGTAAGPFCYSKILCFAQAFILNLGVYTKIIQDHFAPSGYLKLPNSVHKYQQRSGFLAKLNNEIPESKNFTYKERFMSLENLVLIKFDKDKILKPKESSWFGFYPDGSFSHVLPPQQTYLYIEDWIGLKALDEAGKVKYISAQGNHLDISEDEMKKHIVPYLKNEKATQLPPHHVLKQTPKQETKERELHLESKHIMVQNSDKKEPYPEAKHTSKEMSTQEILINKEFLEHMDITPLVVYNWRPTFLKVRWQCHLNVQKIRR